jgi:hypothetical protein
MASSLEVGFILEGTEFVAPEWRGELREGGVIPG